MTGRTSAAIRRRTLLQSAAGLAALSGAPAARAQTNAEPVTLTYWSWVPNKRGDLDLFEATHPGIKVNLVNAGQGLAHYTKLRTAMRAGTGGPMWRSSSSRWSAA